MSHKLFEGFRIEANALGQDVLEKMPKAVRNRAFPSTLKKLVVCDCMWLLLKKLYKGREMFKSLLMSINVCPCSCRKYDRKAMQTVRGDYANSLLNEKKKAHSKMTSVQCTYFFPCKKKKKKKEKTTFPLLLIITLTKHPPLKCSKMRVWVLVLLMEKLDSIVAPFGCVSCICQNAYYLHRSSVPQVLRCPAGIDRGWWVISGFRRNLGLTDTLGLNSCWYRSDARQDEFRPSQAALLWISKVWSYDHACL